MRYQPYVSALNYSFTSLGSLQVTKLAFVLSDPGLEVHSGTLSYVIDGNSIDMPIFSDLLALIASPLPSAGEIAQSAGEGVQIPAKLCLTFTDGTVLTQDLSLTFVPWLSRLIITFKQTTPSVLEMNALASWEYSETQSGNIADEVRNTVFAECQPLEVVSMSLAPSTLDGSVLSPLALDITCPNLVLIPDQQIASGVGYGRQMDDSSVQEIYQINRTETLSTMNQPWQMHDQDKVTLGEPLSMIDPKTVVAHTAHRYVNQHNLTQHNQPFNYDSAKSEGATLAPKTNTTWNQEHHGNKTITHEGTINHTRLVDTDTQVLKAPTIHQQFKTYDGSFSGDTFQQTAINYHEQSESESTTINIKALFTPSLTENLNTSTQFSKSIAISANAHTMQGKVLNFNGPKIWRAPKIDFGGGGEGDEDAFGQPLCITDENQQDLELFAMIVFAEASQSATLKYAPNKHMGQRVLPNVQNPQDFYGANVLDPAKFTLEMQLMFQKPLLQRAGYLIHFQNTSMLAIRSVASVIKNRMNIKGDVLCKPIVSQHLQFDAYIDPSTVDFANIDPEQWKKHSTFIQAYARMRGIAPQQKKLFKTVDYSLPSPETMRLYKIMGDITDIYLNRDPVTTKANYYFSPVALVLTGEKLPSWSGWPRDPVNATLAKTDDFIFIDGSWP